LNPILDMGNLLCWILLLAYLSCEPTAAGVRWSSTKRVSGADSVKVPVRYNATHEEAFVKHMNRGDVAVEKGRLEEALAEYAAAAALAPDNLEVLYWHAVTLATNGMVERSLPMFRRVFAEDSQ